MATKKPQTETTENTEIVLSQYHKDYGIKYRNDSKNDNRRKIKNDENVYLSIAKNINDLSLINEIPIEKMFETIYHKRKELIEINNLKNEIAEKKKHLQSLLNDLSISIYHNY